MTDTVPPWLANARALKGTLEAPGSADNPAILEWPHQIAQRWPEMATYTRGYTHDSIAWCGLFVAYCVSPYARPPFGSTDTDKFLWANAWSRWGTKLDNPKLGCVMVFTRNGGGHVAFYESEDDDFYYVTGGNQSDSVSTAKHSKDTLTAAVWPPDPVRVQSTADAQVSAQKLPSGNRFEECLAVTLRWEGGNDDDPRDPGGRTSRGILQDEWDAWRQSRGGLPQDVWDAPQSQIEAIYRQKYWDRVLASQMAAGVDLVVFDFAVNSGGGVKVIQRVVGTDPDGEVGPITLAALAATPANQLIDKICDARMDYLQGLAIWPTFGRGWTNRVNDVRSKAHTMISEEPVPMPKADPSPLPQTVPQAPAASNVLGDLLKEFGPIIAAQIKAEMQKPETQAAVKGLFATVLPKILGALGVSVPGVGIIVAVAGYLIPALMAHGLTPDTVGQALLVSGGGLATIPVVSKILGILDRFGAK